MARLLVVVDVVIEDAHLVRAAYPTIWTVVWGLLTRAVEPAQLPRLGYKLGRRILVGIILHVDPFASPTGDLHVGDLDVHALVYHDALVTHLLLTEARAVQTESGYSHMVGLVGYA